MNKTRYRRKLFITLRSNAASLLSSCPSPSQGPSFGKKFLYDYIWALVNCENWVKARGHKRTKFPYCLKSGFLTNESLGRSGTARPTQKLDLPLVRLLHGHKEICWSDLYMLCNGIFMASTFIPVGLTTGIISVTFLIFTDTAAKTMASKIASLFFLLTIYKLHLMFYRWFPIRLL